MKKYTDEKPKIKLTEPFWTRLSDGVKIPMTTDDIKMMEKHLEVSKEFFKEEENNMEVHQLKLIQCPHCSLWRNKKHIKKCRERQKPCNFCDNVGETSPKNPRLCENCARFYEWLKGEKQ